MPCAWIGQERMSDPQELELQMVVNHCVGGINLFQFSETATHALFFFFVCLWVFCFALFFEIGIRYELWLA